MPQITHDPVFTVKLTRAEMRLVGLALAGRLKDAKDVAQAKELNKALLEHRKRLLLEELSLLEGAQGDA